MKVVSLPDVEPGSGPRRVAIGTFDGVHLGHREVIRGADTVLTFDPHPLSVIHPEATPKLISPFPVKRDLIAGLGVDELVVIPFDSGFSSQTAEEFVQRRADRAPRRRAASRWARTSASARARKGTPEFLREHDEFETRVAPLVEAAGETISSSHIRGLVAAGEVAQAAEFLGGPFLFEGEVVTGDRRGRELGMPTANLVPDERYVVPGPRRLRRLGARLPGRGERRRAADLRDRPRPARGGAPDRLRRATSTARRCGSPSSSGCAARSASSRWTSWSRR